MRGMGNCNRTCTNIKMSLAPVRNQRFYLSIFLRRAVLLYSLQNTLGFVHDRHHGRRNRHHWNHRYFAN